MSDMLRLLDEQRSATGSSSGGAEVLAFAARRQSRVAELRATIDRAVIPRLHQAHLDTLRSPPHPLLAAAARAKCLGDAPLSADLRAASRCLNAHDVTLFVDLLLADDREACDHAVAAHLAAGIGYESLFLELLGAAAVRLHGLQENDLCGLAEGALAFATLLSILRQHASAFRTETAAWRDGGHRALLVAPASREGGVAMFGLLLLSEFFRRDGWDSWVERDFSSGVVRDTVLTEWFDLVEVMVSSDQELDAIASGIRSIRRNSQNRAIGVVVCGEVFERRPDLVGAVGADARAADPLSSLAQARCIIARPTSRARLS